MRSRFLWALGLLLAASACKDMNCSGSGLVLPTPAASEVDVINCVVGQSIAVYRIKGATPAEFIGTLSTSWDSQQQKCSPGANSVLPVDLGTGQYEIRALLFPKISNTTSQCNALQFDTANCSERSFYVTGDPQAQSYEKRFK